MDSSLSALDAMPRAAVSGAIFCRGQVLLVQRGKAPSQGLWSLPGGHIEPGEAAADALHREIAEETGVRAELRGVTDVVDIIRRDAADAVTFHRVVLVFYGIWLSGEPRADSDVQAVMWCDPADIAAMQTTPGLFAVVDRAWARLSHESAG
jgi:8-oxo-dGTP diphosphatase